MAEPGTFLPDNRIGEMLVSARSFAEYRKMFSLTGDELRGRILDCPGGAASFTAEVGAHGGRAIACDPQYVLPTAELARRARADLDRGYRYHQGNPDEYVWTFFRDPEHYLAVRSASIELFTAHFSASPGNYVAAGLPALPFPDRGFDLALCSHLLFSYADRLGHDFHLASIRELARVAREVRIHPLVPMGFDGNPELPGLIAELDQLHVHAEVRPVDYEFQRGGHSMLACRLNG
jgi:hypothetical protein